MATWEQVHEHIRQMRDFVKADRDGDLAEAEREAAAAAARGDEWWRRFYQERADRLRAYRFDWETDRDAA